MDPATLQRMVSSDNQHWNTPKDVITPIVTTWHSVALDPCSNKNSIVPAKVAFSGPPLDKDGLAESWQLSEGGLVFVNPPYGRKIAPWIQKCADEAKLAFESKNKTEILLLGPARTDTKWFQRLVLPTTTNLLFWEGRLKFLGAEAGALFPSFLAYWGHDQNKFLTAFTGKGWFIK